MSTQMKTLIAMLTALILAPLAYGAGSGPMSGGADTGGMTSAPRMTPQQMAAKSYNAGLNHKKRAQEYEEKAAAAKDDKGNSRRRSGSNSGERYAAVKR